MKTTRSNLYHRLVSDAQLLLLPTFQATSHHFYGNVPPGKIDGQPGSGYEVTFDVLPAGEKKVRLQRGLLKVIAEGEAEVENDHDDPFPDNFYTGRTSHCNVSRISVIRITI